MKFSFVVPVYKKSAHILRKCLKSLLEQSHKDIEIIASFDGGDLDLEKVANEVGVKVLINEHKGASAARNAGAKLASGDFISFWDADCVAEPNMAEGWSAWLSKFPEADFVYSGYRWTDPTLAGFNSERFDPFTLERYNYIAPMFPVKREKAVAWDESLAGLQDWDYWRRIVKNGGKGIYVDTDGVAYPFATEPPDADSISGPKANVRERIETLRAKFADPRRDILVLSGVYKDYAIDFAKILDADYFANPHYWKIRDDYKALFLLGFDSYTQYYLTLYAKEPCKKIVYWLGQDAEALLTEAPVKIVNAFKKQVTELNVVNLCQDKRTQDLLTEAGLSAEIASYPMRLNTFEAAMPPEFSVMVNVDDLYLPLVESIAKAMPDIKFDFLKPGVRMDVRNYVVHLELREAKRLSPAILVALLAGRVVVSNIQEPFCGYVNLEQDMDNFKHEVIAAIRAAKAKPELNTEARDYYREQTSPAAFKARLEALVAGEAVNV